MKNSKGKTTLAPILMAVFLCVCMVISLLYYVPPTYEVTAETLSADDFISEVENETLADDITPAGNFDLTDGVYEGTGNGYSGTVTVAVTIKNKTIVSIEILSADKEDAAYLFLAKSVIDNIINSQSLEVDTISGATYSSRGIINAVLNALYGIKDTSEIPNANGSAGVGLGSTTVETVAEDAEWEDGTYYGSGTGFGGTTTVEVVIKDGKIVSINVVSHNDTSAYFSKALSTIISRILSGQTTNVDTVSGATYSSVGIINAVRDALNKAAKTPSEEEEEVPDTDTSYPTPSVTGMFPYNDGYYEGIGAGYLDGATVVGITIKDGTIISIEIISTQDDEEFFNRAKTSVINAIISSQDTDVDTVSGATHSAEGIIEAVINALKAAKEATEGISSEDENTENNKSYDDDDLNSNNDNTDDESDANDDTKYKDGVYTATVTCSPDADDEFIAYELTLTVTIEDGVITSISNVNGKGTSDNDSYISRAANGTTKSAGVIAQIINSNGISGIDTVSGATCSSNAIIAAVKSALTDAGAAFGTTSGGESKIDTSTLEEVITKAEVLSESDYTEESWTALQSALESAKSALKAKKSQNAINTAAAALNAAIDALEKAEEDPSEDDDENDQNNDSRLKYSDGTYSASVVCYPEDGDDSFDPYNVTVTVVIENGIIVSVTDISSDGDEENDVYMKYAAEGRTRRGVAYPSIPSQIVDKNGTDEIDAVSGATCSSGAIVEAVKKALEAAAITDDAGNNTGENIEEEQVNERFYY